MVSGVRSDGSARLVVEHVEHASGRQPCPCRCGRSARKCGRSPFAGRTPAVVGRRRRLAAAAERHLEQLRRHRALEILSTGRRTSRSARDTATATRRPAGDRPRGAPPGPDCPARAEATPRMAAVQQRVELRLVEFQAASPAGPAAAFTCWWNAASTSCTTRPRSSTSNSRARSSSGSIFRIRSRKNRNGHEAYRSSSVAAKMCCGWNCGGQIRLRRRALQHALGRAEAVAVLTLVDQFQAGKEREGRGGEGETGRLTDVEDLEIWRPLSSLTDLPLSPSPPLPFSPLSLLHQPRQQRHVSRRSPWRPLSRGNRPGRAARRPAESDSGRSAPSRGILSGPNASSISLRTGWATTAAPPRPTPGSSDTIASSPA